MTDCLFCKIIAGEIPSQKVYEDDKCLAFKDIAPLAPVHFLVVPKAHFASAAEVTEENAALIGHIYAVIAKLAKEMGLCGRLSRRDKRRRAGRTNGEAHPLPRPLRKAAGKLQLRKCRAPEGFFFRRFCCKRLKDTRRFRR